MALGLFATGVLALLCVVLCRVVSCYVVVQSFFVSEWPSNLKVKHIHLAMKHSDHMRIIGRQKTTQTNLKQMLKMIVSAF